MLVLAGVIAPIDGASRAVVFAAAGCCAVLDVLLHRSGAGGPREPESLSGDESAAAIEPRCPSAPGRLLLGHGPDLVAAQPAASGETSATEALKPSSAGTRPVTHTST